MKDQSVHDAASQGVSKTPNQRRSKERGEKKPSVAIELSSQNGSDAMRMSQVAKLEGVSIGPLAQ